ncbi:MAG: SpoVG family protein [Pirellulales bacterium]
MEITEVRIKLMEEDTAERLKAFCSITFDNAFVIRDLKIIEGSNGPFVAMPSRKLTAHCPNCHYKNHLRASFCNQCARRMGEARIMKDEEGRAKLYADIAHPINSECRDMIQRRVVQEFYLEIERSKQAGYTSRYDDPDLEAEFVAAQADGSSGASGSVRPKFEGPATEPRAPHRPRSAEFSREGSARKPSQRPPDQHPPADRRPIDKDEQPRPDPTPPPDGPPAAGFGAGIFE